MPSPKIRRSDASLHFDSVTRRHPSSTSTSHLRSRSTKAKQLTYSSYFSKGLYERVYYFAVEWFRSDYYQPVEFFVHFFVVVAVTQAIGRQTDLETLYFIGVRRGTLAI